MKIIFTYMFAVIALIIFSACSFSTKIHKKVSASEFSEYSYTEKKEVKQFTESIKIERISGDVIRLTDWAYDSNEFCIAGTGLWLSAVNDTIGNGMINLPLDLSDIINFQKSEYNETGTVLLYFSIPIAILIGFIISSLKIGMYR